MKLYVLLLKPDKARRVLRLLEGEDVEVIILVRSNGDHRLDGKIGGIISKYGARKLDRLVVELLGVNPR